MKKTRILVGFCLAFLFFQTSNAQVLMSFNRTAFPEASFPAISFEAVFTDFNDITDGLVLDTDYLSKTVSDPNYGLGAVFFFNPGTGFLGAKEGYRVWTEVYPLAGGASKAIESGGWNGPFDHFGSYSSGVSSFVLSQYAPTTPIPEPEIYALMMAGLGVLGLVARRKKLRAATA
jgi:hypothetical protein